ncbi:MAG: hypothetical protein ACRYGK_00985 [Janthinobacterium lividum]
MIKTYSKDENEYDQKSVSKRIEAFFLNNIGLVVTREQILKVSRDPLTGREPENWHQRLSELRTDKGYTILTWRDKAELAPQEYLMPHIEKREGVGRRVVPTKTCWSEVILRAKNRCEWAEDGQRCNLIHDAVDPVGGGDCKTYTRSRNAPLD